jgi:outer membrane lipoprotein-sorting protein
MKRIFLIVAVVLLMLQPQDSYAQAGSDRERILGIAGRIEDTYGKLQSYVCDIEGIYFSSGKEFQRYIFKFFFLKPDRFRIEFSRPYSGMIIFYTDGEKEFTSRPFQTMPSVLYRFSVDNPFFKSPAGQSLSQLHLTYFLSFLKRNAGELPQDNSEFLSDEETVSFWLQANDYLTGKVPERYRIFIYKKAWLPARFERYDVDGHPLEYTLFRNCQIDPSLDRTFFESGYRPGGPTPEMEPLKP